MKHILLAAVLSLGLLSAQDKPFAYANVINVVELSQKFGLPYPPFAMDYIQVLACEYKPGDTLVVQVDYLDDGVSTTRTDVQKVSQYGSTMSVFIVNNGNKVALQRIWVNSVVMWQAKTAKPLHGTARQGN